MHDEREGYLEILSRITTEEEFFSLVLEICGNYGFEFFSFGARAPFPLTAPKYHFLSNYPGEWKSRYISEDYTSIDPIVRHGLLEYTPLIWNGEDFQENRFFWEEALHHGIRHGWSIPVRGKYGLISMLSLVRSSESIAATEILEKESFLLWITSMLQATFGDLLAPRIVPESNVRLTARETEMLKWTAVGKTYGEIGLILSIDQRTVKFHILNAMRKLNSSNKAEATMKAYAIGLLN
ncbi:quorum-sensing transcriptional repressor QscR [Pseudomonas aeruginosa]|uniref:quorum-sensing transcriptional repressor QscR n=1 Tax=Pseudomonas aeruginosa TaxID=287 RepID=UPI003FD1877E